MALRVNTSLQGGKYRIVRFIASGGFGCTYEALHTMLQKRVAIKEFFVKDFCNRDETTGSVSVGTTSREALVSKLKKKFLEEARSLSRLNHPGIVRVTDVFEENGTAYFVMDYIEGESLGEMVKKYGPIPERQAVKYILDVCSALEYVHANNRLHLDIKPGNIIVAGNGNAILIDFGASKQYDEESGENNSTLLGKTPGYAPLEQLGNDVSTFLPATDIYSLGATLYKLLTGVTPPGSNHLASGEPLPPLPPATSQGVYNAIMWALELNKHSRPQSVNDFRNAIYGAPVGAHTQPQQHTVEETVVEHQYDMEQDLPVKKSKYKRIVVIATVCLVGVIVLLSARGCSGDNVDRGYAVQTDTLAAVIDSVTDMPFVNSKGTRFSYTGPIDKDSVPDGVGKGVYQEGTYKGVYVKGLRHGDAIYDTGDGENHFEGTYEDDMYKEGKLIYKDKSYYKGTFKDNNFYNGTFHNADGSVYHTVKDGRN